MNAATAARSQLVHLIVSDHLETVPAFPGSAQVKPHRNAGMTRDGSSSDGVSLSALLHALPSFVALKCVVDPTYSADRYIIGVFIKHSVWSSGLRD